MMHTNKVESLAVGKLLIRGIHRFEHALNELEKYIEL